MSYLLKALYGHKQVPNSWFPKFHITINQLNFYSSSQYSAFFTWKLDNGIILLLVYVSGMIITSDGSIKIEGLKQFLCKHFEMKDIKALSYFMGHEVLS